MLKFILASVKQVILRTHLKPLGLEFLLHTFVKFAYFIARDDVLPIGT